MNEFELEPVDLSPRAVRAHIARGRRERALTLRRGLLALRRGLLALRRGLGALRRGLAPAPRPARPAAALRLAGMHG